MKLLHCESCTPGDGGCVSNQHTNMFHTNNALLSNTGQLRVANQTCSSTAPAQRRKPVTSVEVNTDEPTNCTADMQASRGRIVSTTLPRVSMMIAMRRHGAQLTGFAVAQAAG